MRAFPIVRRRQRIQAAQPIDGTRAGYPQAGNQAWPQGFAASINEAQHRQSRQNGGLGGMQQKEITRNILSCRGGVCPARLCRLATSKDVLVVVV